MKPLTIEQLKSLEMGDWVWIVEYNGTFCYYAKIENTNGSCFSLDNTDLYYSNYGTKWVAYKNKEQAECKGEIVELPDGWLDTLKLLTCAASCYAVIDDMIAKGMQSNKALADLFMKIPRVQGSTLQWSLQDLANNNLDCDKIQGFDEVLNAMPIFKACLAELKGEQQ